MLRALRLLLLTAIVFALGHWTGTWRDAPERSEENDPRTTWGTVDAQPAGSEPLPLHELSHLTQDERRDISVFRDVAPSVVNISTLTLQRRNFFSLDVYEIPSGTGSGFVWDTRGHIVTNFHVIGSGRSWRVSLGDEEYEARLVGVAQHKDLAVLRIDAPREVLRPILVGDSASLVVGQKVLAIGNPFGLDQSLSVGVLSALGRELKSPGGREIRDVIQIDAAINPGNSGGPLLDSRGRLIGVNTAIYSPTGASAGIGFAVPVDIVSELVPQLIEYGEPRRPGIGVELVSDYWARRNGVNGVIVQSVQANGPAARAGIRGLRQSRRGYELGDVIVAVDGEPVTRIDDLVLAFEERGVGGRARLTLIREQKEIRVDVDLIALQ